MDKELIVMERNGQAEATRPQDTRPASKAAAAGPAPPEKQSGTSQDSQRSGARWRPRRD
jgi:hypothetical protein